MDISLPEKLKEFKYLHKSEGTHPISGKKYMQYRLSTPEDNDAFQKLFLNYLTKQFNKSFPQYFFEIVDIQTEAPIGDHPDNFTFSPPIDCLMLENNLSMIDLLEEILKKSEYLLSDCISTKIEYSQEDDYYGKRAFYQILQLQEKINLPLLFNIIDSEFLQYENQNTKKSKPKIL